MMRYLKISSAILLCSIFSYFALQKITSSRSQQLMPNADFSKVTHIDNSFNDGSLTNKPSGNQVSVKNTVSNLNQKNIATANTSSTTESPIVSSSFNDTQFGKNGFSGDASKSNVATPASVPTSVFQPAVLLQDNQNTNSGLSNGASSSGRNLPQRNQESPAPTQASNLNTPPKDFEPKYLLVIKAKGALLNGIGPKMGVYVDGVLVNTFEVNKTEFAEFSLDHSGLKPGAKIDLFYSNDEYYGKGKDRNLTIESISVVGGLTAGVYEAKRVAVYDVGNTYSQATDGLDVVIGKDGMSDNGAMRFLLKDNSFSMPIPNQLSSIMWSRMITTWGTGEETDLEILGRFARLNNYWNAKPNAQYGPWYQQVGISLNVDDSVNCHIKWSFTSRAKKVNDAENIAFPECFVGLTPMKKSTDRFFPKKISEIKKLTSQYAAIKGNVSGRGQITYNVWLIDSLANVGKPGNRKLMIELPVKSFEKYGLVRDVDKAFDSRVVLGGKLYDVYWKEGSTNVLFHPIDYSDNKGGVVNWKVLLDYLVAKNITDASYSVAAIELGVSPVIDFPGGEDTPKPTNGDLSILGFNYRGE